MSRLGRWYRGDDIKEEKQKLFDEMDRREQEKRAELHRKLTDLGLNPGQVVVWRLARTDVGIFTGKDISLYVLDCPDCAALVRLDAYTDHDQWHRRG